MLEHYITEKLKSRSLLLMTHAVVGYPSLDDNWKMLECMQEAGVELSPTRRWSSQPNSIGRARLGDSITSRS